MVREAWWRKHVLRLLFSKGDKATDLYEGGKKGWMQPGIVSFCASTPLHQWKHWGPKKKIFQHGDNPNHTIWAMREWLQKGHLKVLEWPGQCPDLNSVENLRREWNVFFPTKAPKYHSSLRRCAWAEIYRSPCLNFVQTIMKWLTSAIANHGYVTKYWGEPLFLILKKKNFWTITLNNPLEIIQCDFLFCGGFFCLFVFNSMPMMYLWWTFETSSILLSGTIYRISGCHIPLAPLYRFWHLMSAMRTCVVAMHWGRHLLLTALSHVQILRGSRFILLKLINNVSFLL